VNHGIEKLKEEKQSVVLSGIFFSQNLAMIIEAEEVDRLEACFCTIKTDKLIKGANRYLNRG